MGLAKLRNRLKIRLAQLAKSGRIPNMSKKKQKINWNLLSRITYVIVVFMVVFLASITFISALNIKGGLKILSIQSGSMAPSLPAVSVVVIMGAQDYQVGDVITYVREGSPQTKSVISTTHRITEIKKADEGTFYVTKGDFNSTSDGEPINKDRVLGKVFWAMPYFGYLISFVQNPIGFLCLVVIPATLIVYSEILVIKNQLFSKNRLRKALIQRIYV